MTNLTVPISFNSMTDQELKSLVDDPNAFLGGLNAFVRPSPIQPITRSKIENLLQQKFPGKSSQDLKKAFDAYAMVKVTSMLGRRLADGTFWRGQAAPIVLPL